MATCERTTSEGQLGDAFYEIELCADRFARVTVRREFPAGTAEKVWQVASDFAGLKANFPSLVRLDLAYPDDVTTLVGTVRTMTFAPPAAGGDLGFGVEQLVELDNDARTLEYVSVLGLPIEDYRSRMTVTGDDACQLTWASTCKVSSENELFLEILAQILASGANQIEHSLGTI